ncbi:COMM domain-containing protein 10 isoform X2 [Hydra vulgaris]|uniref:COMM domain-containing protein 10 isoform X2 n=1 Tax=Hydra vulgaris TaxID=6087 RepID=A0ABM4D9P5_HYDVU
MSQQWYTLTKSLASAVDIINAIEVGKLTRLCKRVLETIHLKNDKAFTSEEEDKLQLAFDLSSSEVELLLEIISFIWEQAAYHLAKGNIFAQQLSIIGIHEDKIEVFTSLWKELGPIVIEHFRKRSLAPKQLDTIKWNLNVEVAQAKRIKLKAPNAIVELGLDNADNKITEKIQLQFDHSQLYSFFNQLEAIQLHLDALN